MLVGLVILGVFIIRIEDIPVGERGDRLIVTARFDSAAGVDKKAAVRIAGVRIGKVEDIMLDGAEAVLVLSLDPGVHLNEGASAQVASMGMLGDRYVEILPGNPGAPPLPSGGELAGSTPPTFDDVMRVATETGGDVKEVTEALRSSVGGQEGAVKLAEIVDNIRELTDSLKVLIEQNQRNVNETTANFREFSATLRDELPRIADKMNVLADQLNGVVGENRENVDASLENIRDLSGRLKSTADNLNAITGKIASGEGSIGKLVNDDETVDNLNKTLESIDGGVETLKNSFGRFDRFRLDMVIRGEALSSAEDGRFAFGFDLWTNERRFFRLEGVDTPYGKTSLQKEVLVITYDDGTTETTTTEQFKTEDKIQVNAQIGYRFLPKTFVRAGLFEGAGGFAIDYSVLLVKRPLRLTVEAYDFNRRVINDPHLRLEGRYFLSDHIFLMAGWDDPLFSETSAVLFGGGVLWTDEDLKYSLGMAAGAMN
jgi:phospholipid/cholesterol/gamma-HCH transport system substrate-binding protein